MGSRIYLLFVLGLVLGPLALAFLGICKIVEEEASDLLDRHHVRLHDSGFRA